MSFEATQGSVGAEDHEQGTKRSTDELHSVSVRPGSIAVREPEGISFSRLIVGSLFFLALTVGVFWYQFNRIQAGDQAPTLGQLKLGYLVLMLLCLPLDTFACGLRIWVVSRVLQPGLSLWTCLKAEWANLGLAMLTPSNTGGGLGQIYMLNRGGSSVGTAVSISLITFLGSLVGLLCIGLYSLLFSGIHQIGPFFYKAVWFFTLVSAAIALGVLWPGLFRVVVGQVSRTFWKMWGKEHRLEDWRAPGKAQTESPLDRMGRLSGKLVGLVYTCHYDVRRFLRLGKSSFLWVYLLTLTFLLSRCLMAFLCLRFLAIDTFTLGHVLEAQMALIFLIYFAPTPGSSGLAEGASLGIMAHIVPIGFAPYYNLLWRFTTLFLPACVGLFFLLRTLLQDTHNIIERKHTQKPLAGPDVYPER